MVKKILGIIPTIPQRVMPEQAEALKRLAANTSRNDFGYIVGQDTFMRVKPSKEGVIRVFFDHAPSQNVTSIKLAPHKILTGLVPLREGKVFKASKTAFPLGEHGISGRISKEQAVQLVLNSLKKLNNKGK